MRNLDRALTMNDILKALDLKHNNPDELAPSQLKVVLDYLYDGDPTCVNHLLSIQNQFRRAHAIFLWMCRNQIRGKKINEFFMNESGDEDGGGLLSGVTRILNDLDGVPRGTRLKVTELKK